MFLDHFVLTLRFRWYIICVIPMYITNQIAMIKEEMQEEIIDNEPIEGFMEGDDKECCSSESQVDSDNVTDESFESDDKSAQMSDAADEWKDKYLRLVAEFDNYRKRTLREKMDLISNGGEDVIKSLLEVMDDIDRAIVAMDTAQDIDSVKQGIVLIHQKLMDTLRSKGVVEIDAIGDALDTDLHEAVAKFPVADEKKGKIIDVVQKGYKLKDKVVRFAKVVVGE